MDDKLCLPNDIPAQSLQSPPSELLQSSLEQIIQTLPPKDSYDDEQACGFFMGYTGIAFLLFQISALRPSLEILGHDLIYWTKRYMEGKRDADSFTINKELGCGLLNEKLCFQALQACLSKEHSDVLNFLGNMPEVLGPYSAEKGDPYETELLYGRTGVLYLLRMLRRWAPNSESSLEEPIAQLVEKIMGMNSDGKGNWEWNGDRIYGPPHGDIGIITQLVLTLPSLAPKLAGKVEELLGLQGPDGNWPSSRNRMDTTKGWERVQYCHGAPGFVCALQTLRPFYPEFHDRIDQAIARGRETTWSRGLLTKEPNLCHGILGNAFAFPVGPQREHFLALCTPDAIKKAKEADPKVFLPAAYGTEVMVTLQYLPSAAWTWAVCEIPVPPMLICWTILKYLGDVGCWEYGASLTPAEPVTARDRPKERAREWMTMKVFNYVHAGALVLIYAPLPSVATLPTFPTVLTAWCRSLPGDDGWPTVSQWKSFNSTVDGRLIETRPLGSTQWIDPQLHMESSSSIMAPFFANQSCDPWTPASRPCKLGNYVSFSVNATSAADIKKAVNFAREHNIRLVIRNTGHDYSAKSIGAGALAVWTHHLKSTQILDWKDPYYDGKAIKMGAGVQGFEAMAAAGAEGLVSIGGECPTVGVAGGYTQGGGHSALSTSFGLGADQTLSFEVVTANGELVTASRTDNSDLYWALSGGGGGTYGIVVSMTAKVYPDATVSGATLIFQSSSTTMDNFYAGVEKFHSLLPAMVDAGSMMVYFFSDAFFQIGPMTAYNKTSAEVKSILSDFVAALDELKIPHNVSYSQSATYTEHYDTNFGPLPYGNIKVGIAQYGGRLIPRATIENNNAEFMKMARNITEDGVLFIGVGTDVSAPAKTVSNSVLPAWRKSIIHATLTTDWNFTAPWEEMIALQDKMTDSIMPQIEAVTPGSGAYMNEADFRQPDYKEVFFGSNYEKLLSIKKKWDEDYLFYAITSVGSDHWNVAADGRMCRA
ncbi:hypothetical protein V492_00748 [Pseudogymnoascus sp. VKM F-4246]|nr:hypothetical protein V492_00748 [Pseudogymnoascus sp. VKM F-4246]